MNTLLKIKWFLKLLGWFKIPMIGFTGPKIIVLNEQTVRVKIKLKRRTKNHLKSMYFGALAVGADLAAGLHAFYFSQTMQNKISFAFKGMTADFLKRAESDIIFETNDGLLIKEALRQSIAQKKRINQEVLVNALNSNNEVVATFKMISSVKVSLSNNE